VGQEELVAMVEIGEKMEILDLMETLDPGEKVVVRHYS